MEFLDSVDNAQLTIDKLLTSTIHQIDKRRILSVFNKFEAILTVRRQVELSRHGNPQKDKPESRYKLFNMWRQDEQPVKLMIMKIAIGSDSMNRCAIPPFCEIEEADSLHLERQEDELSIMLQNKETKPKKHEQKPKQQSKKKKYVPSKQSSPTKFLIPIQNVVEEEPQEITMLRQKKIQQESTRKGSEVTSCAALSKSRQATGAFESRNEYQPENRSQFYKKRPQTSNVYLKLNSELKKPNRIMTATKRI